MSTRFTLVGLVSLLLASVITPDAAAQSRGAVRRMRYDQRGDLILVGNTMHCRAAASGPGCRAPAGPNQNNNEVTMRLADVNSVAGTAASSSATLSLPAGATVTEARLYWFCPIRSTTAFPTAAVHGKIKLRPPGAAAYTTLDAALFDTNMASPPFEGYGRAYLAQTDVTQMVRTGGNGDYFAADMVCAGEVSNVFSGWVLAVLYADATAPLRTIALYDAFNQYTSETSVTLNLSGFVTPSGTERRTRIGIVVGDGDPSYGEDFLTLNGTRLFDPLNPDINVANSTVSRFGQAVTARNPNYANTLGLDIDLFEKLNALPAGASSATIVASTDLENVFIGLISFSTEIFAPSLETGPAGGKTVVNVDGGATRPGDLLEYTIGVRNTGGDAALDVRLADGIPANTSYVAGSLRIDGADPGNRGEFDPANNRITARLGSGANATSGGRLAPAAQATVTFRVRIATPLADGTVISNQASFSYFGETLGTSGPQYSGVSDGEPQAGEQPTTIVVTSAPNVTATKTGSYDDANTDLELDPGERVTFTIAVTNSGDDSAHDVVVSDVIDANLVDVAVTSSAGVVIPGATTTVAIGDLAVGETVTITVAGTVRVPFPASAQGKVSNQAVVSGGNFNDLDSDGDPGTPGNNPTVLQVTTGCECFIGGACVGAGTSNAANACEACDPTMSTSDWSPVGAGGQCGDGKDCTTGDTCDGAGSCMGTVSCTAGLECQTGACDLAGACAYTTNPGSCVIDGACVASGTSNPANQCEACRPEISQTGWSPRDSGAECNDGLFCTDGESCNGAGACVGAARPCDDGLACTSDGCDEDADSCTATIVEGSCVIGGACVAGGVPNPGNACQVCRPEMSTGDWSPASQGTPCSDGSACTDDVCDGAGSCGSTPRDCSDVVSCTVDSCLPSGDCAHVLTENTCVIEDVCTPGGTVNPENACQVCSPASDTGNWSNAGPETTCDDGLGCTTGDSCADGLCHGTSTCDDGRSCTADVCTVAGCASNLLAGFCLIDGACVLGGTDHPTDPCLRCVPAASTVGWTAVACTVDGGVVEPVDAGVGGEPDAPVGGEPDAGVGGEPDAAVGGTPDGAVGGTPDAAVGGTPDGATPSVDARVVDAATSTADARRADSGTIVDPLDPAGFVAGGGCDCRAAGGQGGGSTLGGLLLLLGVVLVVRRPRK